MGFSVRMGYALRLAKSRIKCNMSLKKLYSRFDDYMYKEMDLDARVDATVD